MRSPACLALVLLFCPCPVFAATLEATDGGFVLKQGREHVRFDRGNWTAALEGGPTLRWHMFLWHDRWVYETLPRGTIASGPKPADDGSLVMSGTFSAREGSPPVRYAYRIAPADGGVRVRCELEKTAPLKLTNGVWLHLSADRKRLNGTERVWISPAWHGSVASPAHGVGDKFLIELRDGRSLCLGGPGFREVNKEGSDGSYVYRVNLLSGDFETDEKATIEYTVSFADMPDSFPGDVRPMRRPLKLKSVTSNATKLPCYERLQLDVDLGATYDNPYDPDQVALDAVFTAPSGKEIVVPGFFMVSFRRRVADGAEIMVPEDNGRWKVRFAPAETGRYRWQLRLRDRTGQVAGGQGTFEAVAAQGHGFVRTSRADPHYFAFDDGTGYFAVGHNLPIYHTRGQLGSEAMRRFAAAGENFNRWWMSSSGLGIEWAGRLGWYRQDTAARIDLTLDLAKELGLYYMMCMDTHQDFRQRGWEMNPFNAKNGGPCRTPADWFTGETARKLYKKRLRYTVARWGYSPNVLCWEFGNEFEGWANSPNEIKLPWHKEMAAYLRSIDPFGHLVTTSFWSKTGPEEFWKLKDIDIVQTHCYTNDDGNVAEAVRRYCLHQRERFAKPHVFGEFGIRSHSTTADKDPEGWAIHNALWAGLTSFSAGGPMPWWHERYIDKLDLYFHFTALARFAEGLPLGTARWELLKTAPPEYVDRDRPPETRDAAVIPVSRWGKPEHEEFTVLPDGSLAGDRLPQQLLHGAGHRDIKRPPAFLVDYPQAGKFVVRVRTVSNSGLLRIWIDGKQALERNLPCAEGLGKASVYRPQWKLWETTYDEDVAVDVPPGKHRIRVENLGKDWVSVAGYTFTGCKVLDRPNVLVCGMKTAGLAMLWLQNRDSSWVNHAAGGKVHPVPAFRLAIEGLPDGDCQLHWWETWKGEPSRREPARVQEGRLTLTVPELKTDVAVKIIRTEKQAPE